MYAVSIACALLAAALSIQAAPAHQAGGAGIIRNSVQPHPGLMSGSRKIVAPGFAMPAPKARSRVEAPASCSLCGQVSRDVVTGAFMLAVVFFGSSDDRLGNPNIMTAQKAHTATIG
jgi:hypothetical protein